MLDQTKIDLSKYRIEAAYEDYHAAVDLLKMGHYKVANNRAYYAIFHAMRAVLALERHKALKNTIAASENKSA